MPLLKRLSRSEISLRMESPDDQRNDEEKRPSSKSDPPTCPKIYIGGKPLTDSDSDNLDKPTIHRAVSEGNLELLKELVESGAEPDVNRPDPEGWPPLYTAIKQGKLECAAYLLKKGASDFYDRQREEYQKRLAISSTRDKSASFS